jgi:hypothetical protein
MQWEKNHIIPSNYYKIQPLRVVFGITHDLVDREEVEGLPTAKPDRF